MSSGALALTLFYIAAGLATASITAYFGSRGAPLGRVRLALACFATGMLWPLWWMISLMLTS